MGKSQRVKGHNFERDTARRWRRIFPEAQRELNDAQGNLGVDIRNTGALAIQCKRLKGYAPINRIEEIKDPTRFPVLVTKGDGKRAVVVMYESDFLNILEDIGLAYEYDPPPF